MLLVKRLPGHQWDEQEPQTHGINIQPWNIKPDDKEIKINLWDFGGQEIMHATHQFFLSKRSLYILVLDGRKDEKTTRSRQPLWLKPMRRPKKFSSMSTGNNVCNVNTISP
ncbi:MAG: hypothetical protein GY757_49810 [bacterium]|nr:hypothetical protein [bacterium]